MVVDHSQPVYFLLPEVHPTRRSAQVPAIFIAEYCASTKLIDNLRVHWDQLALTSSLQIPTNNGKERLNAFVNTELAWKRATKPSSNDFKKLFEEKELDLAVSKSSSQQSRDSLKRDLPISKRSSINEVVFNSNEKQFDEKDQIKTLDKTLTSMSISPKKSTEEEKTFDSKSVPSQPIHNNSQFQPNVLLATPIHQAKVGRFSASQSRIFGDSGDESNNQKSPIGPNKSSTDGKYSTSSKFTNMPQPPSVKPQRIFFDESEDVATTNNEQKLNPRNIKPNRIFEGEGSPFIPSLKRSDAKNCYSSNNSFDETESLEFVPSLGGYHDALKESPDLEIVDIQETNCQGRSNLVSSVSLRDNDSDKQLSNSSVSQQAPRIINNRNSSQIQFG